MRKAKAHIERVCFAEGHDAGELAGARLSELRIIHILADQACRLVRVHIVNSLRIARDDPDALAAPDMLIVVAALPGHTVRVDGRLLERRGAVRIDAVAAV